MIQKPATSKNGKGYHMGVQLLSDDPATVVYDSTAAHANSPLQPLGTSSHRFKNRCHPAKRCLRRQWSLQRQAEDVFVKGKKESLTVYAIRAGDSSGATEDNRCL